MGLQFDSFRQASRYASRLAKSFKISPEVSRRGSKFAVSFGTLSRSVLSKEAIAVAGVLACLAAGESLGSSAGNQLVLDALRRSSSTLEGMSEQQIGEYLRSLDSDQILGLANNVKGIYHELLFVEAHNQSGAETVAHVYEHSNHPGADVYFTHNGSTVSEIQLKATNNPDVVEMHIEAYPDIPLAVTSEVAPLIDGSVIVSGWTNAEITADVNDVLGELGQSTLDSIGDGISQIVSTMLDIF